MSAPQLLPQTLPASMTAATAVRDEPAKTKHAQALTIREASIEDYGQITALQVRNGMSPRPFENWVALWGSNPVCQSHKQYPIGWVLETDSGDIAGWIGNIP